jgi:hypothetical protein
LYSLTIKNSLIRILPANALNKEHNIRTLHGYKITGIPVNTQIQDLNKINTLLKAKTCIILKCKYNSITKTAYVDIRALDKSSQFRSSHESSQVESARIKLVTQPELNLT